MVTTIGKSLRGVKAPAMGAAAAGFDAAPVSRYAGTVGKSSKGKARELLIDRHWCKGCTICVKLCPTQVLGMDREEKAVVLDISRCTWCRSCELHCPDLAIEIVESSGPAPGADASAGEAG